MNTPLVRPERLLDRYLNGDEAAVWADLLRLGETVNEEPYLSPALAVCREMARRSRLNLHTLIGRLTEIGFEFWCETERKDTPLELAPGYHFRLTPDQVESPPTSIWSWDTSWINARVLECTPEAPRVLPLVVRVWLKEVGGEVEFVGQHPAVCPHMDELDLNNQFADPFSLTAVFDGEAEPIEKFLTGPREDVAAELILSCGDIWKQMYWVNRVLLDYEDNGYKIAVPSGAIDAPLTGIWYDTTFVGFLRKNFAWGGFPGWERYPNRPEKELQFLRQGLLPI